jgi:hypothetical protein
VGLKKSGEGFDGINDGVNDGVRGEFRILLVRISYKFKSKES